MTSYAEELQYLDGKVPVSEPDQLSLTLNVECRDSAAVVARATEVLREVVAALVRGAAWPDVDEWAKRLPRWFVEACRPSWSREEALAWLTKWRSLPRPKQIAEERRKRWALDDWIYWFAKGPDERQWRWIGATVLSPNRIAITIEVEGYPTAYGALSWLLRAAGASSVEES